MRVAPSVRFAKGVRLIGGLLVCSAFLGGIALGAASTDTAKVAGVVAGFQFLPSLARMAAVGLSGFGWAWLVMLALTTVFGRFYCSALCPLGFFQDAIARLGRLVSRFSRVGKLPGIDTQPRVSTFRRWTRVALALIGMLGAVFAPAMIAWVEPYAIAARLGSSMIGTSWDGLGELAVRARVSLPAGPLRLDSSWMALAAVSGVLVLIAAVFKRRLFCRWFCPTGAILELAGTRALFGFNIESSSCTSCGACERVCRTGAASSVGKNIDAGACVSCFDCLGVCPTGATSYGRLRGKRECRPPADHPGIVVPRISRRSFLLAGGTALVGAVVAIPAAALVADDGSKVEVTLNGIPRQWASPPGSASVERYAQLCVSCGICARACPSGVLRQGAAFWKFPSVLVPYMDYERAFCQFECVACGAVCPTGAIRLLPVVVKTGTAIATSRLDLPKCIVVEKGTRCGACAEHCPSGALSMEKVPGAVHPGPVLDDTLCIGCGACETVCPSEPVKALVVSGVRVHETARVLPVRPGSGAQSSTVTDIGEGMGTPGKGDPSLGVPPGGGAEGFAF